MVDLAVALQSAGIPLREALEAMLGSPRLLLSEAGVP